MCVYIELKRDGMKQNETKTYTFSKFVFSIAPLKKNGYSNNDG